VRPWNARSKQTISVLESPPRCLPSFRANFRAASLDSVPELARKTFWKGVCGEWDLVVSMMSLASSPGQGE